MIETTTPIHREPMALEATLRDYFAAKAMQGVIAAENYRTHELAQYAYEVADAMLKARKEQK
jgi:methionine salvage enolase-phosphatase E1